VELATVPPSRGRFGKLFVKRVVPSALLPLIVLGTVGCASEDGSVSGGAARSPACGRLERTFAEASEDRRADDPERDAHDVLAAFADRVPRGLSGGGHRELMPRALSGPVSVLARAESSSREDVEAALLEVSLWFMAECVGPTVVEGPGDRRRLPQPPPAGLPLCLAIDAAELVGTLLPPSRRPDAGQWALWGDASAPNPWSETVVSLTTAQSDRVPVHDDAVPAEVRGRSALVAPAPLFQAVSSAAWGHVVSWQERPGLVAEVALRRGSPAETLRVADQVRFDGDRPYLPEDALGPRTQLLFEGAAPSPLALGVGGLWSASYGTAEQRIGVVGHAPVDGGLHALEYWTVHSEPLTIRGHRAILYAAFDADRGPWGVAWTEPDGLIVQVFGFAPREAVVEVASSLADVSPAQWRAAKAEMEFCEERP